MWAPMIGKWCFSLSKERTELFWLLQVMRGRTAAQRCRVGLEKSDDWRKNVKTQCAGRLAWKRREEKKGRRKRVNMELGKNK